MSYGIYVYSATICKLRLSANQIVGFLIGSKLCKVPAPTTVKLQHACGHSSGNRQGHVLIQEQIKEFIKATRHWPLCGEDVSIWWCHHETCRIEITVFQVHSVEIGCRLRPTHSNNHFPNLILTRDFRCFWPTRPQNKMFHLYVVFYNPKFCFQHTRKYVRKKVGDNFMIPSPLWHWTFMWRPNQ